MKNGPTKLDPNSAPFSPSVYDYTAAAPPPSEQFYYNVYDWWYTPEVSSQRLLSANTMTKALDVCRKILEDDLTDNGDTSVLISYLNSGRFSRVRGLLSHPLSQLFIPPPKHRYIHPAITDHCNGKFCLTASKDTPGFENDVTEDWISAVVGFIYYGLPPIRGSLEEHTCVRSSSSESGSSNSCWICEMYFVFENLDQSRREGRGQPVSVRAFLESLMDCQAMNSLQSPDSSNSPPPDERADVPHGLLSRKIYRKRYKSLTPLLHEVYSSSSGSLGSKTEDVRQRRANRICNGVRIRQHDRSVLESVEVNRRKVIKKVLHTLNYVLHMLNRTPTKRRSIEFPKLGEEPSRNSSVTGDDGEGSECLRIYAESHCQCPLSKSTTTTTKDMLLLTLNFNRYDQHRASQQATVHQSISPDSSELSAFEDSVFSSSDSDSGGSKAGSSIATPGRKPSFNVFTAVATGTLPRRQATVKFVELLADSLDQESEILMMCAQCCRQPNAIVRPHKIREEVTKLPIVLGIKTEGNEEFWQGNHADVRGLIRKYLKAKRQGSGREVQLSSELAKVSSYHPLPSQIYIGKKNKEWDVRPTKTTGYIEYSLTCVITSENAQWDKETRSTLWKIWQDDFANHPDVSSSLQITEVEELMVERPPTEDLICVSVKKPDGKWIMINGPLVAEISEVDVKTFSVSYKRPICVFYSRTNLLWNWKRLVSNNIPDFDLSLPWNLSTAVNRLQTPPFTPLTSTERKLIELANAEYVVAEYISKAKNHLFGKSPRYELGRFTGVRADSVFHDPVAFADFYVQLNKLPLDCRTEFSGLVPQDLNNKTSTRWLTTRDFIYRFLRYLVKNKCKFIGHDLFNDFRVIGITVPSNLVNDTVLLFRLSPQSRLLSLKYLAWNVLSLRIQQSNHDSLEDSWASLLLYRFYVKYLKEHGEEEFVSSFVNQIYTIGYNTNFKTPPPG